jgi:rhodanese-related sulfurtransferase
MRECRAGPGVVNPEFYNSRFSPQRLKDLVKFFLDNWVLFLAAITSGGLLLWPMISRGGGAGRISPAQAVMLINREKAVLIDVSEPDEYAGSHATGSKNVPLGRLETAGDLPKNKTLPLVVVCPTGTRAVRAAATLKKLGYENSHVLAGGLAAWREANLPLEKTA